MVTRTDQLHWIDALLDSVPEDVVWSLSMSSGEHEFPIVTILVDDQAGSDRVQAEIGWSLMHPDESGRKFKTWRRPEATVSIVHRSFYTQPVEREDMNE